jgi:hypothetical protein
VLERAPQPVELVDVDRVAGAQLCRLQLAFSGPELGPTG